MYISQELPQTAVYGSGEWKKEKGQACEKKRGGIFGDKLLYKICT